MNKSFLKGVYEWKPASTGGAATPPEGAAKHMETLQRVFARMQDGNRSSCDPKEFTEQLGIGAQQQDAQEFNSLLMSMLDNLFKLSDDDALKDHVPNLFRGKTSYITTCQKCKHASRRTSDFYELELPIESTAHRRAHESVEQCVRVYEDTVETLEGDNQYFCERCNAKQDAERHVEVDAAPEFLTLQLMRFSYDREKCAKTKVKHSVFCTPNLNLAGDSFKLVAVMYHKGNSASGGHYTAEIKCPSPSVNRTEEWWMFDDETVTHMGIAGCRDATPVDLTEAGSEEEQPPAGYESKIPLQRSQKTPSKKKGKKSAASVKTIVSQTPETKTAGSANAYMLIYQKCKKSASQLEKLGSFTGNAAIELHLPDWLKAVVTKENEEFTHELQQQEERVSKLRKDIEERKSLYEICFGESSSDVNAFGKEQEYWVPTHWLRQWISGEHKGEDSCAATSLQQTASVPGSSPTLDLTEDDIIMPDSALYCAAPYSCGSKCVHGKLDPSRVTSGEYKRISRGTFELLKANCEWDDLPVPTQTCDDCESAFTKQSIEKTSTRRSCAKLLELVDSSKQETRNFNIVQFCLSKHWVKELRKYATSNTCKPHARGTLYDSFAAKDGGTRVSLENVNADIVCQCTERKLVPDGKRHYHYISEETWQGIHKRYPDAIEMLPESECARCKANKEQQRTAQSEREEERNGFLAHLGELHKRPTSKRGARWYPPLESDVVSDRRLVGKFQVVPAAWLTKWRTFMTTCTDTTLPPPVIPMCDHGGSLPPQSLIDALNAEGDAKAIEMDSKVEDVELVSNDQWGLLIASCSAGMQLSNSCLLTVKNPGPNGWCCVPEVCSACINERSARKVKENKNFVEKPVRVRVVNAKVRNRALLLLYSSSQLCFDVIAPLLTARLTCSSARRMTPSQ